MKQIAIDGPAGAGKSSVAKALAEKLQYIYLDTGAMYRALTYKALTNDIPLDDHCALVKMAHMTSISFASDDGQNQRVFCDGLEVTEAIRQPEVTEAVSIVSAIAEVRVIMLGQQRKLAEAHNVVMDGRDIGTIVLPNADFKFFITASLEERAKRRFKDYQNNGLDVSLQQVRYDIAQRDKSDTERNTAPLRPAADALIVDTSDLNFNQVVNYLLQIIKERGAINAL